MSPHLGAVGRDIQRVWRAWQGETAVFCLPDLRKEERWNLVSDEGAVGCVALPTETLEVLSVYAIGDHGHVWSPGAVDLFANGSVKGLLEEWLALKPEEVKIVLVPPQSIELPAVDDGFLARETNRIRLANYDVSSFCGEVWPIDFEEQPNGQRVITIKWPPAGSRLARVSPDAEAHDWRASGETAINDGVLGILDSDGTWRPKLGFNWPMPFRRLFGVASGLDAWDALARMRSVLQLSATERDAALASARTALAPYIADSEAPLLFACLGPDVVANRKHGRDVATWERYGLEGRTLAEVLDDPRVRTPVAVRRVWGGIGLLWALLVERLESATPSVVCELCGRLLDRVKTYCGREDNRECFRSRRRKDKRKSRASSGPARRPRA